MVMIGQIQASTALPLVKKKLLVPRRQGANGRF